MRDIIFWLSGVALAFLVTAGAFLLLANLATAPSEKRLNPDQARGGSGHSVDLILTENSSRLSGTAPIRVSPW
ncbi:MAG: hypothetical protein M3N03_01000 [Actinomycetota bacterium]|nr:hypothetical protein [Actinomycetota bacterium]